MVSNPTPQISNLYRRSYKYQFLTASYKIVMKKNLFLIDCFHNNVKKHAQIFKFRWLFSIH